MCTEKIGISLFLILFGLLMVLTVMSAAQSEPVRLESVAAGDCSACHGEQKVLPPDHVQTVDMFIEHCIKCHKPGEQHLRSKIPLSHVHQLSGIGCADCHENPEAAGPLSTGECLVCHGNAATVAKMTEKQNPNPHNSIHYGLYLNCDLCHYVHMKSENFCNQCHGFDFIVP